jgi:hypothetical protein
MKVHGTVGVVVEQKNHGEVRAAADAELGR